MPIVSVSVLGAALRPLLELTPLGHAGLPGLMDLRTTALTVLFGMLFMLRRTRVGTGRVTATHPGSVDRIALEQATLRENRLTPRDGPAMLPHLGRRREFLGLRLNAEPEERLGGVLPDEPDLLFAHVPEFSYLRHDR